jgi:D-alanine-D-alanine ligase
VRIGLTFNVRSSEQSEVAAAGPLQEPARNGHPRERDPFATAGDKEEEYDSPETIEALAETLRSWGHEVDLLGDGEPVLRRLLAGPRPDLVFNLAEGHGIGRAREARMPAVLEMLGIPYTGSDPLTLAVALDKDCAKRLVQAGGVATPAWALIDDDEPFDERLAALGFPMIVKPACEGSSKGILAASLVHSRNELSPAIRGLRQAYRQPILIEEFIDGDELTVGIVGNRPPEILGVMRVVPRDDRGPFVYSLEVKRDWERLVSYECPARIAAGDMQKVRESAMAAWRALGCRDLGRIDFRLRAGVPYFLEANPLPGLSPKYSDLILMARQLGIEYRDLIGRIVQAAIERVEPLEALACCRSGFPADRSECDVVRLKA